MMPGLLEIMSLIWAWIIWHVFFKMADFPVVCANYGVQGTVLEGLVKPYVILERKGIKVGVFGLSPALEGLVQAKNCEGVVFENPIELLSVWRIY